MPASSSFLRGIYEAKEQATRLPLPWQGREDGAYPSWLAGGALLRNGPGLYQVGEERYQHLFDGLALLRGFYFDSKAVSFASRFLRSPDYEKSLEHGKISFTEFATAPDRSWLERIRATIDPARQFGDNSNVNLIANGKQWWAIYDWPVPLAFDPKTLATKDPVSFGDGEKFIITTPHPLYDAIKDEWINFGVGFGLEEGIGYRAFRMKNGGFERQEIAFVERLKPAYMHSFAMTQNFLILTEHPFYAQWMNMASMGLLDRGLVDGFAWEGNERTRFLVLDRTLGRHVADFEVEPFLVLHHANAFDDSGRIVIDLSAYPDDGILKALYLDPLEKGAKVPAGRLRRYTIDLSAPRVTCRVHDSIAFEMPRINDAYAGRPYSAIYGTAKSEPEGRDFFDALIKIDPTSGASTQWHEPGTYPSEPIFVARPGATAEDDGVVLSVVRDPENAAQRRFFLLVLDARSFVEIGRAAAPPEVDVPPDFHGAFTFLPGEH